MLSREVSFQERTTSCSALSKFHERLPWKVSSNPKKGVGIHCNMIGSSLTGIMPAGRCSGREETTEETMRALSSYMFGGVTSRSHAGRAEGCIVCQDRECASDVAMLIAMSLDASTVGTQKRAKRFPIAFGGSSIFTQHEISSSGIRESVQLVKRIEKGMESGSKLFALGH